MNTERKMNSLWMGNLEPYMDEEFIHRAFAQMGETVMRVRLIRDKITGETAGYGFVELIDETSVERCLRKVNGKPLPGATPPKRFKLSRTTYGKHGESRSTFSLFVSDLTPDVDDGMLYEFFNFHFSSCCSGKIVLDSSGYSKCCGFVSFESEREQRRALAELQGACGLGKKPLRLSLAANKLKKKESPENQNTQFYADNYNISNSYLNQYYYPQYSSNSSTYVWNYDYNYLNHSQNILQGEEMEDDELEYPDSEINVMEANERFMDQSEELYSALIDCFFQPPESWDGVTCSVTCYLPEPIYQHEDMD
ncbi:tRNA selenocysteine 1-associated protein 1 isoform X2 [Megalobrama amblycephala]|uniref:tRNA selenocysteine 1-associated protein 1 isoform X2 n=1 Tax=Megalobrama amblycephala TaxID=75352 RepID=UPI002014495F|nr:tRNA selenocysteine 1-associated protein 1 isoform X2 [Megalobrama amblycephala]